MVGGVVVILGLSGSIGMGKTRAAAAFRQLGLPVFESDASVHRHLSAGGAAVEPVARAFPSVLRDCAHGPKVDRTALGALVFHDHEALDRLEAILHPLVRADQRRFLRGAAARRCRLVVLDVPLLFETGGESRCDATAVVSAPPFVQRTRVLRRAGMDEARLRAILARQMSDQEKRRRADFVIPTGGSRRCALREIRWIVRMLRAQRGRKWPRAWARA